jgi:pantetheine-phosphate adenylyltransferase
MNKKMIKAVYGGTFDPITLGHLDIIKRSKSFADHLIIGIGTNSSKKTMFSEEERIKQINSVVNSNIDFLSSCDISVESFSGLLVEFARKRGAKILVRGIRSVSDFEYEITLANANKLLAPDIETVFLPTSPNLAVVSSSAVKEIGMHGGPIHHFVTPEVERQVRAKFGYEPRPESGFLKYGNQPSVKTCPKCTFSEHITVSDDKPSFTYCRNCGWIAPQK